MKYKHWPHTFTYSSLCKDHSSCFNTSFTFNLALGLTGQWPVSLLIKNEAISQLLKNNLFRFINSKDGNYIINYNGTTSYVNKKTKFITKYVSDDIVFEYNIDLNNISENNVSKNNLYK